MRHEFLGRYPNARLAKSMERQAGKEFGPERLKKENIATTLNIKAEEISDAEWEEISEFAVNAGAELMRAGIKPHMSQPLLNKQVHPLRQQVRHNDAGLLPFHDLYQAAQTYRESGGHRATPQFIAVDSRERYTNVRSMAEELYPLLFFASSRMHAPLPVLLSSAQGREELSKFLSVNEFPEDTVVRMHALLRDEPQGVEAKRAQYEALVWEILSGSTRRMVPDISTEELAHLEAEWQNICKNPPELYAHFAPHVFSEEWRTNPRLFLDELLACIRTKPTAPTQSSGESN